MVEFIENVRATTVFEGCHPPIQDGINRLLDNATLSHSVTSRKFSTISLAKKYLDLPLAEYFRQWEIDFTLSHALKKAPLETRILLNSVVRIASGSDLKYPLDDFTYWKEPLVRFYASHYRGALGGRLHGDSYIQELEATIDSVISLIDLFLLRRPQRVHPPKSECLDDGMRRRIGTDWNIDLEGGIDHTGFCERCWRYSEFEEYSRNYRRHRDDQVRNRKWREHRIPGHSLIGMPRYATLSKRFCNIHKKPKPLGENASEEEKNEFRKQDATYRRAYNQRGDFHAELKRLKTLHGPRAWPEDVRKEAFENTQQRISRTDTIIRLAREGVKQAEIAHRLEISRQAVSKTLKRKKKESGSSTSR